MKTNSEETKDKIRTFKEDLQEKICALSDNILLESVTNGILDGQKAYSYLSSFRKDTLKELQELVDSIPIVNIEKVSRCLDSMTESAQDLRYASLDKQVGKEVEKRVDSIYNDSTIAKKELGVI